MTISSSAWRNLKLGLAMLTTGALLAACGGGGDDTPVPSASMCDTSAFATVLHAVPTGGGGGGGGGGETTTLKVHYQRTDGVYTDWQLHTWGAAADPGWNAGYNSIGTDSFGAIYTPTLASTSGSVGYLLHKGDDKDMFGGASADQSYTLAAGVNEIWRKQGDPVTYTSNPDTATVPDVTKVRVHYMRYGTDYAKWGLHLWNGGGINWDALPTAAKTGNWDAAVAFADMPGYVAAADGSEVSFEIPVINPTDDPTKTSFAMIVHGKADAGGDAGNKDGWDDGNPNTNDDISVAYAAMTIAAQTGEVWLVQGRRQVFYSRPDLRSASTTDAGAVWLSQDMVKWPNVNTAGTVKLYYSSTGALRAPLEGDVSGADGSITMEVVPSDDVPDAIAAKFAYVGGGVVLQVPADDVDMMKDLHKGQIILVQEDDEGKVQNATGTQIAGALDGLYASAKDAELGVKVEAASTGFKLWAPTAQKVTLCLYNGSGGSSSKSVEMTFDADSGVWSASEAADLTGSYYKFAVEVFVRGVGVVRNMVTDPYSVSLSANSARSYIADLDAADLKPADWDTTPRPVMPMPSDISVYQTHIRDFSIADSAVAANKRGKFVAFADPASKGMAHLQLLADAGLTHVQFLPIYDGGSVNELTCTTPSISPVTDGASPVPTATIAAQADNDCFNWGFDPVHYNAIDGTYATNPSDGAVRVREFREAVLALHKKGLGVVTDMVYNHTYQSGQGEKSILDRIVPGYYHRLEANGAVSNGFGVGLPNTASENMMFEKLMIDTAVTFAVDYKIDAYRFDWMSDHSVGTMKRLRTAVINAIKAKEGNDVGADNFYIFGEGWGSGATVRFGGDPDGAFEAGQRYIGGTGLGVFNDRIRDGMRGVSYDAHGEGMLKQQGWINGRWYDTNEANATEDANGQKRELYNRLNYVRSGLTGAVRDFMYPFTNPTTGTPTTSSGFDLEGGYHAFTTDPQESVNYVAVHDNRTLYDYNTLVLPLSTTMDNRVRVQALALGTIALSQGMAFFTQGSDMLISKDFDNDSYNSGDWFNQVFWDYSQNNFGIGLPNAAKNTASYDQITPLLRNTALKPNSAQIIKTRDLFIDMLKLRYSSPLMRLRTGADVKARLKFYNADTEVGFDPTFVVSRLSDTCDSCADLDPNAASVVVVINVDKVAKEYTNADFAGKTYTLSDKHSDTVVTGGAAFSSGTGKFTVPARSIAVFVEPQPAP